MYAKFNFRRKRRSSVYTSSFNRSSLAWRPSAAEWSQDLQRTDDLQRDAVILQTFIQSKPLQETDMHKDMIARYTALSN